MILLRNFARVLCVILGAPFVTIFALTSMVLGIIWGLAAVPVLLYTAIKWGYTNRWELPDWFV